MSGLEKFQASEAWRTNFKKFLFMERKPEVVQNTLTVTESNRYSLDIGADLKNIIDQKKNKKAVHFNEEIVSTTGITIERNNRQSETNMNAKEKVDRYDVDNVCGVVHKRQITDEIFEASEGLSENIVSDPNSTFLKYLNSDREQSCNNVLVWQKTSDESFEALEKMCDKTASDPNSTLFQYLHSDCKEQVLAEVKKRSADGIISRDQEKEEELLMKINNCTFLDDVEAPSRMWENTICSDTILQTSPVKMVGLLRPSTIMEEGPDDSANSDLSSHLSFRTATKGAHSDISSNTYETAHDSTGASTQTDFSDKSRNKLLPIIDVDQMLFTTLDLNGEKQTDEATSLEKEATIIGSAFISNNIDEENYSTSDISVDLIDLEKTFGPLQGPTHPSALEKSSSEDKERQEVDNMENELDDSIIEILSDDEDEVEDVQYIADVKSNIYDMKTEISLNLFGNNHETYSFNDSKENDKENCSETQEPSDKSMQFNDTMEEVEYMMKKGMEYIAAEAAAKKNPEKIASSILQVSDSKYSKSQLNSPTKHTSTKTTKHVSSASKAKCSTYATPTHKTPISKASSSASKRFDIDIRPFPKFDLQFVKPYVRPKDLTTKQQKFSHIISPIGTYMKKTAKTPLMSSINYKTIDYNSTAILELENESRLYKPEFATVSNGTEAMGFSKLPGLGSDAKRALPKKAYISSDLKHIVDERTPVTIPGGKKIQKYLENVMMPAVLRHEGKFKMADGTSDKLTTSTSSPLGAHPKLPLKVSDTNPTVPTTTSHVQGRNNASLADLSLMSGDISMYRIMDAQKF